MKIIYVNCGVKNYRGSEWGGGGGGGGPLVGSRLKLSIFVGGQLNYST